MPTRNIDSMTNLYVHTLQDLYSAEEQIIEALPKMEKAAKSDDLKRGLRKHLKESKEHKDRLERIFQRLGAKPGNVTCDAIKGIIKEGEKLLDETESDDVRDAGLIASAQKVEHYEIASYGTARVFAQMLGDDEAASLLSETLDEESATDKDLTELAMSGINQAATR